MGAKESTVSTGTKGTKVPNGQSEARHLATQRQHLPPLLLRDRPTELLLQPLRHLGESRIFVGILAFLHPLFELRELLHAHKAPCRASLTLAMLLSQCGCNSPQLL